MPTCSVPRAALVLARPRLAGAGPDGRTRAPSCTCGGELDPCQLGTDLVLAGVEPADGGAPAIHPGRQDDARNRRGGR